MRILIVSQYFFPEDFHINDVVSSLIEKGIEVDVLAGKPNYPEGQVYEGYSAYGCSREVIQGARVSRIPHVMRGRGSKIRLALNYLSFVVSGLLFGPILYRGRDFDIVFVYAPSPILSAIPAIFLGWIKRTPVIIWVQDLWPQSLSATGYIKNNFILNLVEKVVRFIYSHVELLLVQSQAFIEPVRNLAPTTPIKYHPNSVASIFKKSTESEVVPFLESLNAPFTVMFAGNIGVAQAVEVILEAAILLKEHPEIHFIVLGDGSRREWMLDQVRLNGLQNLHLPGRFPLIAMPNFLQKASVLLVTLADQEIFAATVPNKIQAYMAMGRPIIACMNGEGARLVLQAGAGMVVSAENGPGLAAAVDSMYKLTARERDCLGKNANAFFLKNFDHDELIIKLISYFEELQSR